MREIKFRGKRVNERKKSKREEIEERFDKELTLSDDKYSCLGLVRVNKEDVLQFLISEIEKACKDAREEGYQEALDYMRNKG